MTFDERRARKEPGYGHGPCRVRRKLWWQWKNRSEKDMVIYYWYIDQHILRVGVNVRVGFAQVRVSDPSKGDRAPNASSTRQVLQTLRANKTRQAGKKRTEGPRKTRLRRGCRSVDPKVARNKHNALSVRGLGWVGGNCEGGGVKMQGVEWGMGPTYDI